jgi:transposase
MYIDRVPNRNSRPTVLLRESQRVGKRTVKRTLANLTALPEAAIAAVETIIRGGQLINSDGVFGIECSTSCGKVMAIRIAMERLGFMELISSKPCKEQRLVVAMVAQRIMDPKSKLATATQINEGALLAEFGLPEVNEDDLYNAMDWLAGRQQFIERKLANRYLADGSTVFYDVSSSSYHGKHCTLAKRGYNRDGLKLPSIVYGLMADRSGRPMAIRVYPGNTADPVTVPDQIKALRSHFGVGRLVMVGDRGMLTQPQIDLLREQEECGWISCLRSSDVKKLIESHDPTAESLFTKRNLAEITHADFPGERLIVCYNAYLAEDRAATRLELLEATEKLLEKLRSQLTRRTRTPLSAGEVGVKAGRIINKFRVAKHFSLDVGDNRLEWERKADSIEREAALDGIYIVRTSEPQSNLSASDAVHAYKSLGNVEKAFRTFKGVDLKVRPIYHRLENRVRAHIFLCMLAYYVEWHMRQALAPLMYAEEELEQSRAMRDPVAKAEPTLKTRRKKTTKQSEDGLQLRSWTGVMDSMSNVVLNKCRIGDGKNKYYLNKTTELNPFQQKVIDLLKAEGEFWVFK